ncbi:MAG: hypothetical protein R3F02_12340 [Thiolinea sp.]
MIIKSMSRKVPSFDQLINYMDAGASSRTDNIYYNLYSRKPEGIYDEFMDNSQYLKRRKNGVYMYHEVISITRSQQISEKEQIEILRKVVYQYIQDRAKDNLVYGVLHDEKADNLHYHLLISSNHLESTKRHRLSKADFDKAKRNLELYVLECYPELEQKQLISKKRGAKAKGNTDSLSNKGREMQRRTGKTPQRDRVKANLERIFAAATSHAELIELLESERLKLYKRGKHWGVLDESTNRKHRFATLGLAEAFHELEKTLAQSQQAFSEETRAETRQAETKATSEDEVINPQNPDRNQPDEQQKKHSKPESSAKPENKAEGTKQSPAAEAEQASREAEMKDFRQKQAERKAKLQSKR